jgi:hypothetical protein
MNRLMSNLMVMVAFVAMFCNVVMAAGDGMTVRTGAKLKALDSLQAARWGATHYIELTAADLTLTNADNTAMIFTNTVTAPFSMDFRGYVLDRAFDSATTNPGPYGITFSLGTSSASTKWLSSVQVASDATPTVYGSWGTDYSVVCYATNGAAGAVTSPRLNDQSSNVSLLATITPTTTNALSSLAVGKLRCYFSLLGKNYH